jgi:Family of unknown function (DUF6491)
MKRILFGLMLAGLAPAAFSQVPPENVVENVMELNQLPGLESVDAIPALTGIDGWQAVDHDTIIVWATPFKPYLIELDRASRELPFAETIGITSTASQIHVNVDSVRVRGMSYPIRGIFKLTRDEARDYGEDH